MLEITQAKEFNNIKVSDEMFTLIEECRNTIIKAADFMEKICEQGLSDGLEHKEIQEIIFAVFKDAYSKRHIIRLMPDEIKNQNMIRVDKKGRIEFNKNNIEYRLTPSFKVEQWNNPSSVNDLRTVVEPRHGTMQDGTKFRSKTYEMMSSDEFKHKIDNRQIDDRMSAKIAGLSNVFKVIEDVCDIVIDDHRSFIDESHLRLTTRLATEILKLRKRIEELELHSARNEK